MSDKDVVVAFSRSKKKKTFEDDIDAVLDALDDMLKNPMTAKPAKLTGELFYGDIHIHPTLMYDQLDEEASERMPDPVVFPFMFLNGINARDNVSEFAGAMAKIASLIVPIYCEGEREIFLMSHAESNITIVVKAVDGSAAMLTLTVKEEEKGQ